MPRISPTARKWHNRTGGLSALFIIALGLVSCGTSLVRGEAPFVQATGWALDGQRLRIDINVRNVNDEELPLTRIEFTIHSGDTLLVTYNQPQVTTISARGSETIALSMDATSDGVALLNRLAGGELVSLPVATKGRLQIGGKEFQKFERSGHIYNVPGRPGHFR